MDLTGIDERIRAIAGAAFDAGCLAALVRFGACRTAAEAIAIVAEERAAWEAANVAAKRSPVSL